MLKNVAVHIHMLCIYTYTYILAAACKYANDVYADTYTNSATGCVKALEGYGDGGGEEGKGRGEEG